MDSFSFKVDSPKVQFSSQSNTLLATYDYDTTRISQSEDGKLKVTPVTQTLTFKTDCKIPRVGCMLVGWGGNNGSTLTASVLANKLKVEWRTKEGLKKSNYFGSLTQASTTSLGIGPDGKDIFIPFKDLLPMLNPNNIEFDGWDISSKNISQACEDARVLDISIQDQLHPLLSKMKPRPSIYCRDFIAANQEDRANNVLKGTKIEMMNKIREDIRDFKAKKKLDKVIVLWTANTERFSELAEGLNDTADNLLRSIAADEAEVSPSTIFAVASIQEGCTYINGSPQNTFVPGVVEMALKENVFIGGDDFKSGQTKMKSVLADFLVSAGIKPVAIVSYNHLGNNDGKNLSAPKQFRSKEISKRNVVDDMVESNNILYAPGEKPDHTVVIKYVPYVGDSKRALDEYTSEIFMNGHNTIVLHNTCEDSLLAAPIILDLIILSELSERILVKTEEGKFERFHPILSLLSYLFKAPMVPKGSPVINALFRQRACLENIFRACSGLPPLNHMCLEHRVPQLMTSFAPPSSSDAVVTKKQVVHQEVKLNGHVSNGNGEPVRANGIANGYH